MTTQSAEEVPESQRVVTATRHLCCWVLNRADLKLVTP